MLTYFIPLPDGRNCLFWPAKKHLLKFTADKFSEAGS
jgi:hypothetical protein